MPTPDPTSTRSTRARAPPQPDSTEESSVIATTPASKRSVRSKMPSSRTKGARAPKGDEGEGEDEKSVGRDGDGEDKREGSRSGSVSADSGMMVVPYNATSEGASNGSKSKRSTYSGSNEGVDPDGPTRLGKPSASTASSHSNTTTNPKASKPHSAVGVSHKKKLPSTTSVKSKPGPASSMAVSTNEKSTNPSAKAAKGAKSAEADKDKPKVKVKAKLKPAKYLMNRVSDGGARRPPGSDSTFVTADEVQQSASRLGMTTGQARSEVPPALVSSQRKGERGQQEDTDSDDSTDDGGAERARQSGRMQGRAKRSTEQVSRVNELARGGHEGGTSGYANRNRQDAPYGHRFPSADAYRSRPEENLDSRLHEYPEEPGVEIDPALLTNDAPPPMLPRATLDSYPIVPVVNLAPATARYPRAEAERRRKELKNRPRRISHYPEEVAPPQSASSVYPVEYPASPPPTVDPFATAAIVDPGSPYGVTGPAAENQVFTMLGANGKIVNIPPPAHPHLRPGDTITDPTTPHIHGCPYCDKVYVGQHARSICRRHQMSKHGIELDVQVKKSRWDNNPNRPATEEEKHQRTLESKRRWAAKDRRRRRCQKLGLPFEDSDKESDEEDDSVRSNSRAPPMETLRRTDRAGKQMGFKRESTYEESHDSFEANEDYRDISAPGPHDDRRWEAPPPVGYSSRGYYAPDEYATSRRGNFQDVAGRDGMSRRPSNLANDGYVVPRTSDQGEASLSRARSGSVTSEESLDAREEEAPATRGSDSTVNPSFHARTGSWAQQNMSGYGRASGSTQAPYGSNSGQYVHPPAQYQQGLSPVRTATSIRSGQLSPPRGNGPMQGRAILQDDRSAPDQWAELGGPLPDSHSGYSHRKYQEDASLQGQRYAAPRRMDPPASGIDMGPAASDRSADSVPIADRGPKTPPLQSSSGTKAQIDLGAAEILLAMASPAKGPSMEERPVLVVAKNGGRGAEHARRHRSNSFMSSTAPVSIAPEGTRQDHQQQHSDNNRRPFLVPVKVEDVETPFGKNLDPALIGSVSARQPWHDRRPAAAHDLDDPFRPPPMSRSGFDHSSSASRGTGHSPMTPAELGPPLNFHDYRPAPPPAPSFARGGHMQIDPRLAPNFASSSGFTSPATPIGKPLPMYPRPVIAPFDGYHSTTPGRPSGKSTDSPIHMPFSSPNGLDLTHQLGLAPSGEIPESPTWWAGMMGATPDAKMGKRPRHSPGIGEESDVLQGLGSPTKRARATGALA